MKKVSLLGIWRNTNCCAYYQNRKIFLKKFVKSYREDIFSFKFVSFRLTIASCTNMKLVFATWIPRSQISIKMASSVLRMLIKSKTKFQLQINFQEDLEVIGNYLSRICLPESGYKCKMHPFQLVCVRHGESAWNKGWESVKRYFYILLLQCQYVHSLLEKLENCDEIIYIYLGQLGETSFELRGEFLFAIYA